MLKKILHIITLPISLYCGHRLFTEVITHKTLEAILECYIVVPFIFQVILLFIHTSFNKKE